jgi:hypothetical protein
VSEALTLTAREVVEMAGLAPEVMAIFTNAGPFEAFNGRLTARQVLGLSVMSALDMLSLSDATAIGQCAAADAKEGGRRWLVVAWSDRVPQVCWFDSPPLDRGPRRPILCIPADVMFTKLIAKIRGRAEMRARLH